MTERRYGEREVREIFARAAEAGAEASGGSARAHGLTLRELQDMGLEAGLGPEHVARAAAALDAGTEVLPRRRWMGLPVAVGRIVPLEDSPTGPRLHLGTHKRESVDWAFVGVGPLGVGFAFAVLALAAGGSAEALLVPAMMGLAGAGMIAYHVAGLPRWANQHERRMAHIAEWTRNLLSAPLDAEGRNPNGDEDETRMDEARRVASG